MSVRDLHPTDYPLDKVVQLLGNTDYPRDKIDQFPEKTDCLVDKFGDHVTESLIRFSVASLAPNFTVSRFSPPRKQGGGVKQAKPPADPQP